MRDSQRYRHNAAVCLLAAQEASEPCRRWLHLSMASSWLSLAHQNEAMPDLLASWDTVEAANTPHATGVARGLLYPRGASLPRPTNTNSMAA